MRVVFDTNILVSFAIRPNTNFQRIFDYVAEHGVSLVSDETIGELLNVLSRNKFRRYIPLDQSLEYVARYAAISEHTSIVDQVVACRDPDDDKFLSLAVAGGANCIIAGDQHLVEMMEFRSIPIYRPAEFARLFVR